MKAAQFSEYGDPSVIAINEAPKPTVGEGQVLVEVHASSVNPFDSKVRQGYLKSVKQLDLPATLCGDIAGVVAEIGPGVTGLEVGQKAYGQAGLFGGGSGAMAEYALTGDQQVGPMPEGLSFEEAGSLPLAGLSTVQVLVDKMNLQAGQKILIHGGAGGIGSLAVQLAKHLGAHVATTVSGADADYARELGADEVIDYKTQKFEEILSDYDAVFDTVAGEVYGKSFAVLKRGGMIVSMLEQPDEALAKEHGVTAMMQGTKTTPESLGMLREFVEKGAIKPQVGKVFAFEQTRQAFEAYEAGGVRGKVVVKVQ
jgi:alcohol dehydrogenase